MPAIFCWSNGQWQDHWPAQDRGIQYGDGLFETFRFDQHGRIPLWNRHADRLRTGIDRLGMNSATFTLVEDSFASLPESSGWSGGKMIVTRGTSQRGYAGSMDMLPNIQWQLFDAPSWRWVDGFSGLSVGVSAVRLASQPRLAGIKHLNRLEQVLARSEFETGWDEAVMLDDSDRVIEGCMSNLFWFSGRNWFTPSLKLSGVAGVIRRWIMDRLPVVETDADLKTLTSADAVFMTNAMMGIVPVKKIGTQVFDLDSPGLEQMKSIQKQLEALF